jgi:hypothetical protein
MEFIGMQGDSTTASRFVEFNYSATTRFLIEMSNGLFRFWSNGALVPVTAPHPYDPSEFFQVQVKQVNDVCYFCHPNHHPLKLSRLSDTKWKSEELPLRYPPLLDEYVPKETVATPDVTTLHTQPLEMAPEFTVTAASTSASIPTFTVAAPAVGNRWFDLTWSWPNGADTATKTLTMEIRKHDGTWVKFATPNITLSTTTTPPVPTDWKFRANGRNLLRSTKASSSGTWGAETSIVNFFQNGFSGQPASLTFRFVVGAVTTSIRDDHVCHVTPHTGSVVNVPMSPIITTPVTADIVSTYNLPNPTPAGRSMAYELLNNGVWQPFFATSLVYGMSPQTLRIRDTALGKPVLEMKQENGAWVAQGALLTTPTVQTSWRMRVRYVTTTTSAMLGNVTLSGAVSHVAKLEANKSGDNDQGKGGVTVPAGQWQARVTIGNVAVPAGAKATLQKWNGTAWANVRGSWTLAANATFAFDGTTTGALKAPTLMRVLYEPGITGLATLANAVFESLVYPPSEAITVSVNNTSGDNRTMTASSAIFKPEHVGAFWQVAHRRDLSYTEIVGTVGDLVTLTSSELRIVGGYDIYTYGTWKGKLFLERKNNANVWEILRVWTSNKDRNVQVHAESDTDSDFRLRLEDGAIGYAASDAAVPRFLIEASDARTYGLVKVVSTKVRLSTPAPGETGYAWEDGVEGVDWEYSDTVARVNIIRALASQDATPLWAEGAWSDVRGYPAALGLHEQRIWFGGSKHQPQTLWASVVGDFENFRRGTNDDSSITLTLAAEASNSIRWLSSAPGALLVGTGGDEWAVKPQADGPLTAFSARGEVQSSYSSAQLPAKRANDVTLFVQRDGRRIRQMAYAQGQEGFVASDITVLASHITKSGIKQLAFQQAPQAIIWCVTNAGKLVGMTFEKDQNVFGWHQHDTDGHIETIALLHGTPSDELWLGIRRTINGQTVRTVERIIIVEDYDSHAGLIYLDGAVKSQSVSARTSITGLGHLEGKTVSVMINGAVFPSAVVTGGAVQVAVPANQIAVVGLPYESILQPMRQEVPQQDGTSQGRKFKLVDVVARVYQSLGGELSANCDDERLMWSTLGLASLQNNDGPPVLLTTERKVKLESRYEASVNVAIRSSSPFPLTLTALTLSFDIYGQ